MSNNTGKPADFPWLSPYLIVKDVDDAVAFYEKAFGFATRMKLDGDGGGHTIHAEMNYHDQVIMLGREDPEGEEKTISPVSSGHKQSMRLYLYCEDVDAFCQHAEAQGAIVKTKPMDMFWNDRLCSVQDPNGFEWTFATNKGECPNKV